MSKTYVGRRAQTLREADELLPYTKATVTCGEQSYSAGSTVDSNGAAVGRELLVTVPVLPNGKGAELAADLLASVKDYRYQPYEADSALLDPAAELGDGITVGGVYGGIHARTATFSRLFRADVSAPAEEEINSEYPYLSAQERDAIRQKRQTAKNTEDIAQNTEDIESNTADIGTLNTKVANVQSLVADAATITYVDAQVATVETLVADKAAISDLNAAKGRIGTLETEMVAVQKALTSELSVTKSISAPTAYFTNLYVNQSQFKAKQITVNGTTYTVLALG